MVVRLTHSRTRNSLAVEYADFCALALSVRLTANTTDSEPPEFVYDSDRDPHWLDDGYTLEVLGFVEGRLQQGVDGVVRPVDGHQFVNGRREIGRAHV